MIEPKDLIKIGVLVGSLLAGAAYGPGMLGLKSGTATHEEISHTQIKLLKALTMICRNTALTEATRLQCDF